MGAAAAPSAVAILGKVTPCPTLLGAVASRPAWWWLRSGGELERPRARMPVLVPNVERYGNTICEHGVVFRPECARKTKAVCGYLLLDFSGHMLHFRVIDLRLYV